VAINPAAITTTQIAPAKSRNANLGAPFFILTLAHDKSIIA
jgi:hypothetical protein